MIRIPTNLTPHRIKRIDQRAEAIAKDLGRFRNKVAKRLANRPTMSLDELLEPTPAQLREMEKALAQGIVNGDPSEMENLGFFSK